jgi:hypothetical protein
MLTPEDIARLRATVGNISPPAVQCVRVYLEGGPLDGVSVLFAAHQRPSHVVGWCVPTRHGLVVSNYGPTDRPDRWRFTGFDYPGWGAADASTRRDA